MQIQLRGQKYRFLRYAGYSKEKKRAMTHVIGCMDRYIRVIPSDIRDKLEAEEIVQLEIFLANLKEIEDRKMAISRVSHLPYILAKCFEALEAGIEIPHADKVFEEMRALSGLMVKKGYKRPKIGKLIQKDDRQLSLQE